jgi:hypothetical protein
MPEKHRVIRSREIEESSHETCGSRIERIHMVPVNPALATALQVPPGATAYRRKYVGLTLETAPGKYVATNIVAVPNTDTSAYNQFWDGSRIEIAKRGIAAAVGQNASAPYRWGS